MGAITRGFANNIGSAGRLASGAINNTSLSNITALPAAAKSDLVPIIGYGLGSDSAIEHIHGERSGVAVFDSTYSAYCFKFVNIHPSNDNVDFKFNASVDSGSNYNVTKTSTIFDSGHDEAEAFSAALDYDTGADLAQSTSGKRIARGVSSDSDHGVCGEFWVFNPSSTTFVKHWWSTVTANDRNNFSYHTFGQGYLNTTSAVNGVIFSFDSGTLQTGNIRVYGLK